MPMLANRIDRTFPKDLASQTPNGVLYELKRQYYDIASASNSVSLTALLGVVPSSQVLFGSDFPFLSCGVPAGDLVKSGLAGDTAKAIERNNAASLFPRLKS
jgi:predicted TIM-barrel fold metal-dependent hydrolase